MPVKPLPPSANLDHLKFQAKDLLKAHASRDPQVAQRIREFHPRFDKSTDAWIFDATLRLSDAQLTIARECGFPSWVRLKRHIEKSAIADNLSLPHHERIEDVAFRRAVDLLDAGQAEDLRAHLKQHSDLVHQHVTFEGGNYFRNPTLLEFVAENPIRRGTLPANIVEVAKIILDVGAKQNQAALNETLRLVCSGRVPRECRVQIPLIDLLCEHGADPSSAMPAALPHREFEAADALIRHGAGIDLAVAAGFGRTEDFRRLLVAASHEDRHRAMALASQLGHAEIVRLLLDCGDDPNRYNPVGFHSHSTPLHQAVAGGHDAVVRLLVERGALLDIKDTLWQGTPLGWAKHEGKAEIEKYLEEAQLRKRG
jgi:hypothetical protein